MYFVRIANTVGYSLVIAAVCWGGTTGHAAILVDVTAPGDSIIGTSNNTPGSEGVANAIDNAPTKYLNFDRLNTGFTVTPAFGASIVEAISFTSANDAPERDPASYDFSGSNDGGLTFSPISSGSIPAFSSRFEKKSVSFSNSAQYLTYKLIFPTVAGPGGNSMQISEVELLRSVPSTSGPVPEPTAVASWVTLCGLGLIAAWRRRKAQ